LDDLPLAFVSADQAPADAKSIVQIVQQLEQMGYGPFTEVSFDDGNWEVEVYKQDAPYELAVEPRSGKILSEHRDDAEPHPPSDSQPLSQILRTLGKAGYTAQRGFVRTSLLGSRIVPLGRQARESRRSNNGRGDQRPARRLIFWRD